ncbi:MAG: YfhO family protein [Flavobacteriales bacterium]|nr:YfhO family protein [Flavobacteriales bacterium]
MKKFEFKKLLPHITAIVIFISLSLVYFYPVLQGFKLKQGDIEKHKSMAHEYKSHLEKYDEPALWSGNMFAGMPTYLTSNVKYDLSIASAFNAVYKLWLPHPASTLFAYFIGFYILLLCLRINPWLSIVGAIAFALSSYFLIIIEAGHTSKTYAIGYMAPILGGFILSLRGNIKLGFILIAIFTAAQVYVNHLQISYYLFFILLAIWVTELIYQFKSGELKSFFKRTSFIALAAILGILPNLGPLLVTYEYSKVSTRGGSDITISPHGDADLHVNEKGLDKAYITQWSYGIDETWTLLSPNIKGGSSYPILAKEKEVERLRKEDPRFFNVVVEEYQKHQNAISGYFGNQPIVSGPVYIGVILVLLALLALIFVKDRLVYGLGTVTLLAILLSWGKNMMGLTEFFIDYIPGYNKFRAVAMILVIVELTIPLMAILFLNHLMNKREELIKEKKKLFIILGVFVAVLVLFYASPSTFVDLTSNKEEALLNARANTSNTGYNLESELISYRSDIVSSSILYSLKFVLLAIILLVLFVMGKIKQKVLIIGIGVLVIVDLWSVDKEYLNNETKPNVSKTSSDRYLSWIKPNEFSVPYTPSPVDVQIFQNESRLNPEIQKNIQNRVNELKKENSRFDQRKMIDIEYSELMEATHYRVLNTNARLDQDVRTPYFHKTLGGYHGAKMKRYQDIVDFYLGIEHYQLKQVLAQGGQAGLAQYIPTMNITNMLNAKYIIGPNPDPKVQEKLYLNNYAQGNAWFISKAIVVPNADSAILGLEKLDTKNEIIVEKGDLNDIQLKNQYDKSGKIELTEYQPNYLRYKYSTNSTQLAVFSEIYYADGWKAYVNEKEVPYFRANYILRAMEVPQGEGVIEFKFEPETYIIGKYLTVASSLVILLLIGGFVYSEFKEEKES